MMGERENGFDARGSWSPYISLKMMTRHSGASHRSGEPRREHVRSILYQCVTERDNILRSGMFERNAM